MIPRGIRVDQYLVHHFLPAIGCCDYGSTGRYQSGGDHTRLILVIGLTAKFASGIFSVAETCNSRSQRVRPETATGRKLVTFDNYLTIHSSICILDPTLLIDASLDKCRYSLYSNFIFDICFYNTLLFCEGFREICRYGVCRRRQAKAFLIQI